MRRNVLVVLILLLCNLALCQDGDEDNGEKHRTPEEGSNTTSTNETATNGTTAPTIIQEHLNTSNVPTMVPFSSGEPTLANFNGSRAPSEPPLWTGPSPTTDPPVAAPTDSTPSPTSSACRISNLIPSFAVIISLSVWYR